MITGPVIETRALRREFGEVVAVAGLDLVVPAGLIVGLLGPNGAGKSTAIKMLTTLLLPTSGTARVAGFDIVEEAAAVRRRIGYVPQLLSADGGLTARENLTLSARLYQIPGSSRKQRIEQALHFMELDESADRLVRTYSGGMIRRLELAQAMLHEPDVLFLDEPTVGLDPVARRAVWERLRQLRSRGTISILMTTHDMEEAEELCDRLTIMHGGTVATEGTPAQLKAAVGPEATLDDVFVRVAGLAIGEGGNLRDVRRARSTANRLG